jgi:glycosyltransferase involved in cell wall biosynthesis
MPVPSNPTSEAYVLMTAAHNEEAFIEATIRSVLRQTLRPARWVIVSDNSSDRTDEIVESYAREHDFLRFLRLHRPPGRNFGAKVKALHQGVALFEGSDYAFIGNLDADITLEASYFEQLIRHFQGDSRRGILGGFVHEDAGAGFLSRRVNDVRNVAHAAQLVRRQCYEEIGGYAVLKYGGEDWYAQTAARMKGWKVEALPQLNIYHHRHTGGGSHPLRNAFRLGRLDHSFGSDPAFEVMKCLRRARDWPYFLITLARLAGFVCPYLSGESREVPEDFAQFLRREQKARLHWALLGPKPKLAPADSPLPALVASEGGGEIHGGE